MRVLSRLRIFASQASALPVLAVVLVASGCAAPRGGNEPVSVRSDAEVRVSVSARGSAAKPSTQTETQLIAADHVRLGTLSVSHIYKVCFPDGCEETTHSKDAATRLLEEAAERGADLVVLDQKNVARSGQASEEEGECTKWEDRWVERKQCSAAYGNVPQRCYLVAGMARACKDYKSAHGRKYYQYAQGKLWRHDAALAKRRELDSAMHDAIVNGRVQDVQALIAQGVPADRPNIFDQRLLSEAVKTKQFRVADLLLEKGADPNEDSGNSIVTAAGHCALPTLQKMVSKGAKLASISVMVLEMAARSNCDVNVVSYLIDRGAAPAQAPEAMQYAARSRAPHSLNVMTVLLKRGGKPTDDALREAVLWANDPLKIKLLLDAGADPNIRYKAGTEGDSLIQQFVYGGFDGYDESTPKNQNAFQIVKMLMAAGADPDKKGSYFGFPALMTAAERGYVETVKLLVKHGADVNGKSLSGKILDGVDECIEKGPRGLRFYKEKLAKFQKSDEHKRYMAGMQEISRFLIASGAKKGK